MQSLAPGTNMNGVVTSPPPASLWLRLAAALIRKLPIGRYRVMNCLPRRLVPFRMPLPAEFGRMAFQCDLRDSISREVCFTGRYEPQETVLMKAILKPGMAFVDVGANWGYFTLLAAHRVRPLGRVASLEPDPRMFAWLRNNLALNGLDHVVPLPVAAAAAEGTTALAGYDEASGNFGLSRLSERPGSGPAFRVAARSLDGLLEELSWSTVDLLKMDIEGAEGLALAGLERSLTRRRIRRLLLELHPAQLAEGGQTAWSAIEPLRRAGYRAWRIDHSLTASHRASYAKRCDAMTLLEPFQAREALGRWPHLLWVMPGLPALDP